MLYRRLPILLLFAFILSGCGEEITPVGNVQIPTPTDSKEEMEVESTPDSGVIPFMAAGDIIVTNGGNDSVLLLDSKGDFKAVALNLENNSESVYGLDWSPTLKKVLVSVDGSDRIVTIDPTSGDVEPLITNGNLAGTLRGVTELASGAFLVIEGNVIERFFPSLSRQTLGDWPKALQTAPSQVDARSVGGFILCSTGSDIVGTYDDDGVLIASTASGIAGTTNGQGCMELADGKIAVSWSGSTDTLSVYNSSLSVELMSFSDVDSLGNPGPIAQRANGNILVADRSFHYIVELTSDLDFVDIIGDAVLNLPQEMLVVPEF